MMAGNVLPKKLMKTFLKTLSFSLHTIARFSVAPSTIAISQVKNLRLRNIRSNTSPSFTLLRSMSYQTPKIAEVLDLDSQKNLTIGMRQQEHMWNTNQNPTRGSLKHGSKSVNSRLYIGEKSTQFTIYLEIQVDYLECYSLFANLYFLQLLHFSEMDYRSI